MQPFHSMCLRIIALWVGMSTASILVSASEIKAGCGQIVEKEYFEPRGEHVFVINMSPGDVIKATAIPVGNSLHLHVHILEPAGRTIYDTGEYTLVQRLEADSGELSGTGTYRIHLFNYDPHQYYDDRQGYYGSAGLYSLHLSCVLRNGTEITAGSGGQFATEGSQFSGSPGTQGEGTPNVPSNAVTEATSKATQYANEAAQTAAGIGQVVSTFKNLFGGGGKNKKEKEKPQPPPPLEPAMAYSLAGAPPMPSQAPPMPPAAAPPAAAPPAAAQPAVVAFTAMAPQEGFPGFPAAGLATLALPSVGLGMPLQAALAPQPFQVAGFQFTGTQGMKIELAFARLSGNLSLGLLLLDPNRKLVFQGSVVANDSVSTSLTLPVAGEYRLGIARIEPLPPSPSETTFSISLTEK